MASDLEATLKKTVSLDVH